MSTTRETGSSTEDACTSWFVKQGEIVDRTVVVTFSERDPEAYVFTFG